jgi:hypothetical protein
MEKQLIKTIVDENNNYKLIKIYDEIGNEYATGITYFQAHCKYCDYVQDQNRGDILSHLKITHNK